MAGWPPSQVLQRASKQEKRALAKGLVIALGTLLLLGPILGGAFLGVSWPWIVKWPAELRISGFAAELAAIVAVAVWFWRRRKTSEPANVSDVPDGRDRTNAD